MRYPAALLPEVHVQLQAAQLQRHANLMQAQMDANSAGRVAALGSGVAPASGLQEAPTPVNPASLAKAMRKPRNIRDFFKPVAKKELPGGGPAVTAKRAASQDAKPGGLQSFLVGAKRAREAEPALLTQLTDMGFSPTRASEALGQENDLDRAVARLLANDFH